MDRIKSFEQWLDIKKEHNKFLLFVETDHCSVCHGLLPQVKQLKNDYPIPFYIVNVAEVREMAGQLSLFTAPVVMLYFNEKEYARFARFVPMKELNARLNELVNGGDSS